MRHESHSPSEATSHRPDSSLSFAATKFNFLAERVCAGLSEQIEITPLVYFRIVFGIAGLSWVVRTYFSGMADAYYVEPRYHFKYLGFAWVRIWPAEWNGALFFALGVAAIGIACGLLYRLAAITFAVGFTWVFLVDKAYYLNHYYLICLLSWIMVVLPAHRAFSLDSRFRPGLRAAFCPAWTLWLLRFQIGVPYFFGGLAKLNSDWLRGQPMRMNLEQRAVLENMPLLAEEWFLWLVVYGGVVFDLFIVPGLLWKKARPFAFAVACVFHVANSQIFDIGVFPWLMILATVLFFPADFLRRLLREAPDFESLQSEINVTPSSTLMRRLGGCLLGAFVLLQITVPLRGLANIVETSWTEEGHCFAWHMMLRGKRYAMRLYATDPRSGRSGTIDLRPLLSDRQVSRCAQSPRMIRQLCHYAAEDLAQRGIPEVRIHVLSWVSLNGRRAQLMIDPDVDLAAEPTSWGRPSWIMPLTESFRPETWDLPLAQWEAELGLPPRFAQIVQVDTLDSKERGAATEKPGISRQRQ